MTTSTGIVPSDTPVGWLGYPCVKASRMARYRRRLSLIVCSFWIGRAFQRAYPMGQPLNYLFQNDLEKCPVENLLTSSIRPRHESHGAVLTDLSQISILGVKSENRASEIQ